MRKLTWELYSGFRSPEIKNPGKPGVIDTKIYSQQDQGRLERYYIHLPLFLNLFKRTEFEFFS